MHFRVGTDCPTNVRKAAARLFDHERDGILAEDRLDQLDGFIALASKSGHELRTYDDALDFVAGRRDAERRVAKLARLFPRGAEEFLSDKDQRRLTCGLQNMRMSCSSTYLLDQESDHGLKSDELAALLYQLFTTPDAKAVVFSQWTRMHDVVIRRLTARGIGYVSFHGGVPSEKRPELVQRFRDDPTCRVFLSTDAGSTGLNLQHASMLVNMDLPWNPAVLEQRIARIHRLGQTRPVQVVNFVAKGTIEEGMLSVLAFKRSLAEGILDGGSNEVSLGGLRLTRFMKDVESVTGSMGSGEVVTAAEEAGPAGATDVASAPGGRASDIPVVAAEEGAAAARDAASDPWQALLQLGAEFIGSVAGSGSRGQLRIERDPTNGSQSLRVPLPSPEIANRWPTRYPRLPRPCAVGRLDYP